MNIEQMETPATYVKSKQGQTSLKKKGDFKVIAMLLGLLIFIGGAVSVFLITQKQNTTPVAPTAPQSQPAAYIEKTQTCTLEFTVTEPDKITCGLSGCESDDDCSSNLICIEADNGNKYCADEDYKTACIDDPNTNSCCTAPEEDLLACGEKDCTNSDDCEDGYVCISTSDTDSDGDIVKYCADEDYLDECVADPSSTTCCEATTTVTPTVTTTVTPTTTVTTTVTPTNTVTATSTPTPSVTTVITTVGCNETCNANADCSNISHICYNGQCRLDVNPTDSQCKLANGETTIVRPINVPTESGPADWMNYIKAGLGALGVGALLLLLL